MPLRALEEHLEGCVCCTEVRTKQCDKFSRKWLDNGKDHLIKNRNHVQKS